ncbi:MAG: hypothetical protein AYL31_001430 [Candidatus Bathyarchaeota archaeon B26-1]|nr:MAG: hypothetical protein AYL31_001430 [Candidatus Bathyarchaeota archaeon B26-1]
MSNPSTTETVIYEIDNITKKVKGRKFMARGVVTLVDCRVAGISGDMFLGALIDLGADSEKVVDAIESLKDHIEGCRRVEVDIRDVVRGGFRAKKVDFRAEMEKPEMKGIDLIRVVEEAAADLGLREEAKRFASKTVRTLVSAEAKLHGATVREVHLHEAGMFDTPAEIVGSAVALEGLGLFDGKVYSTPVAVGGGAFKFSHGVVSSPAPATLEILRSKGFPMIGGPVESELATPTGVSILVNLVDEAVSFYPPIKPRAVGYGAGARDFAGVPNVLRIVVGEPLDYGLLRDEVAVIETNLDDVTGEVVGHVAEKILREGARDVSILPAFMKKGRPGHIVKVIADLDDAERLSRILMEETGSLGVRVYPCGRRILLRRSIPVEVEVGGVKATVSVKVAKDSRGRIVQVKPEYEDARRLSEETGLPLKEILRLAEEKARRTLR